MSDQEKGSMKNLNLTQLLGNEVKKTHHAMPKPLANPPETTESVKAKYTQFLRAGVKHLYITNFGATNSEEEYYFRLSHTEFTFKKGPANTKSFRYVFDTGEATYNSLPTDREKLFSMVRKMDVDLKEKKAMIFEEMEANNS